MAGMVIQLAERCRSGPALRCCIAASGTLGENGKVSYAVHLQCIMAQPNRAPFVTRLGSCPSQMCIGC